MADPSKLFALCDTGEGCNVLPWRDSHHDAYADACEQRPEWEKNNDLMVMSMEDLAQDLLPENYG